ncbi:Non-ribosomal peptide synthetase (fragment) [Streptantibioticus cattleyicolor NRRL 8057 = DSM 46488]
MGHKEVPYAQWFRTESFCSVGSAPARTGAPGRRSVVLGPVSAPGPMRAVRRGGYGAVHGPR